MQKLLLSYALAFTCIASTAQEVKKTITLEDLFKYNTFAIKDVPGFTAMKDGRHYTKLEEVNGRQYIKIYDLESGKEEKTVFDNLEINMRNKRFRIDGYTFSEDERQMLFFVDNEHIYRRSVVSQVFVYDLSKHTIAPLDAEKVMHATFSPDGSKVAYVKNNNLFIKHLKKDSITQITYDGEWNKIIYGNCDWVYEEEFGFSKAFEWSKTGKYLAYYRFDESKVPYYYIAKYSSLYPEQYSYKYPKAGERNSDVQIRIYNTNTRETARADVGEETDQYIPRIKWTASDNKLCVYRLNRLQNKLELLYTNAATGKHQVIYKESNKYYINIDDEIRFLPDGQSMIFMSERSGKKHLYHYEWEKQKLNDITDGNYDVSDLVGVDEEKKVVYYTAAYPKPMEKKLFSVHWRGGKIKELTTEKGTHAITPCEGNQYFLDRHSTIASPPVYRLINAEGKLVRVLEDNNALRKKIDGYKLGAIRFIKVKGQEAMLNGYMITPPAFDSSKKYPVLMYQYSGPGSQEVADRFPLGNFWWHQLLASKGYIILCVDGTGTGFRGEEFAKKTYLQLGKYESDDQIAVAKNIGAWSFVDKNRIGIWGWSYGGFMSSTCLFKGNEVFKAAIAVAPVTNWRYYDNIYTERYMRTPQENPSGYDNNSPEKMAEKLKGKFLLIHGTADDNVHFQNAAILVNELVKAGKDFDSEYYPDRAHGISGGNTRFHLYSKMTQFLLENL
jgi:dipeptidyl-peptidase 4